MLGVIVTIWPPGKRRWKVVVVGAFAVFAVIGGVCVHRTQVAAERAQTNLEARLSALQQGQGQTLNAVGRLGKHTEALANRPVIAPMPTKAQVSAILPKEAKPKLTWDQQPAKSTHITDGARNAVRITIRSDKTVIQPEIEIRCSSPISYVDYETGDMYNGDEPTGRSTTLRFELTSPKLSPQQPCILVLSGRKPIRVVAVRRLS